jgi:Flp pilus assembly protein TadD
MTAELLATGWHFHQTGELARAEQTYRQVVEREPDNAQGWYLLGSVYQARGDLPAAAVHLDRALQLRPGYLEALNRRGILYALQGQLAEAAAKFRESLALQPADVDIQTNLAVALLRQGQLAEATALLLAVVQQRPDYARAQRHLGEARAQLRAQQRPADAEACSRAVARLQPESAEAHNNLGIDLLDQHRLVEARACFQRAVQLDVGHAEAHNNLAVALWHLGQLEEAAVSLREAVRLRPDYSDALSNLGEVLRKLGRFEEAALSLREAVRLRPDDADALNNLGLVFHDQSRFEEALASFARALEAQPNHVETHWNRALTWLQLGDLEKGLAELEWKLKLPGRPARLFAQPRWDGSPLARRTILLYAEDGLGDTIQFVRYARLAKEQGATVIVECQRPLRHLLASCPGIDHLVARGDPFPPFDVQVQLASLAYYFRTRLDTIPADIPYLWADPTLVEQWWQELAGVPTFKIGIAWRGSPGGDKEQRSIPLQEFAPLAAVPGVRLISLQKGPGSEQLAAVAGQWPATDLSARLDEAAGAFMDTAAVMQHLDLVVTCDTSIVHVAGALGVPVWVALSTVSEWRWFLNREDSPWYPTVRLFRQERRGEWRPVFERMAQAVRQLRSSEPEA